MEMKFCPSCGGNITCWAGVRLGWFNLVRKINICYFSIHLSMQNRCH
jgi:hypothetical protein